MASQKINKDLERERKKCTFNVQELIHMIDDGEDMTKKRKEIGELSTVSYIYIMVIYGCEVELKYRVPMYEHLVQGIYLWTILGDPLLNHKY